MNLEEAAYEEALRRIRAAEETGALALDLTEAKRIGNRMRPPAPRLTWDSCTDLDWNLDIGKTLMISSFMFLLKQSDPRIQKPPISEFLEARHKSV
jgi:hypothetical protein